MNHFINIMKQFYKGTMSTFRGGHIGPAKTYSGKIIVLGNAIFATMLSTLYITKLISFLTSVKPVYQYQSFADVNQVAKDNNSIYQACCNSTTY